MSLKNKKILIVVGGGISAYKALDLIRLLKKNNVDVKTILTKSGKEFVTPLSITTLTKNKTFEDLFDKDRYPARSTFEVSRLPKDVNVEMVFDPPWDMSLMSDEARLTLNMF